MCICVGVVTEFKGGKEPSGEPERRKDQESHLCRFQRKDFVRKDAGHGITNYEEATQLRAESLLCHLGLCDSTPCTLVFSSIK